MRYVIRCTDGNGVYDVFLWYGCAESAKKKINRTAHAHNHAALTLPRPLCADRDEDNRVISPTLYVR